ncbi:hypothetical protein CVT24_012188 [Panaeolus cyanescens]|uniref:Uncharacterized protein n=1 Tax=Panaeolus cyanescens TaxID=181874 RepID=A0A409W489_9AGAR|nr:hypothetical protein CVT24_012188 [Panaeolus cyanescens]
MTLFNDNNPKNNPLTQLLGPNVTYMPHGDSLLLQAMNSASTAPHLVAANKDSQYPISLTPLTPSDGCHPPVVQYHVTNPEATDDDLKLQIFGKVNAIGPMSTILRHGEEALHPPNAYCYRISVPMGGSSVMRHNLQFQTSVLADLTSSVADSLKLNPLGPALETAAGHVFAPHPNPDCYIRQVQNYVGRTVGSHYEDVEPIALITGSLALMGNPNIPLLNAHYPTISTISMTTPSPSFPDLLRTCLEQLEGSEAHLNVHHMVGVASPSMSFVDTTGFAPEGSNLSHAEYFLTLTRPSDEKRAGDLNYGLEYDRQVNVLQQIQNRMSRGEDAEFLLIKTDGQIAVRLRRLVFDRTPPKMRARHAIRMLRNWQVPNCFLDQLRSMEGSFIPCHLTVYDRQGNAIPPAAVQSSVQGKLVRAAFCLRHLYMAQESGEGVDLFLGFLKQIDILE